MAKMTAEKATQTRQKWKKWLKQINCDLGELLTGNEFYKEIRRIAPFNSNIVSPAYFFTWIQNNHVDSISSGIRRLNDHDKRAISLHRLLQDILKNREAISRTYFVSKYPKAIREQGADYHFEMFANKGENLVSVYKIKKDLSKLDMITGRIKVFVDKHVAHCDLNRNRFKKRTFKDIDEALKDLDQIYCKYHNLLTQQRLETCKPVLELDWKEPLRHIWLIKGHNKEIHKRVTKAAKAISRSG